MKKLLSLILVLCLVSMSSAFALNYSGRMGNDATFETIEEARVNGPAYADAVTPSSRASVSNPALDAYPVGTTYIYRSSNLYGRTAAVRLNTNILVYTDEVFEDKAAALAYITELGLVDIIEEATGSVVLVTPINGKTYTDADEYAYYLLQTAMYASNYAELNYYGGFGYRYLIGVGAGATFINEFVASEIDYVGRIGGMLLVGGDMNVLRNVDYYVPVYMVNPTEYALNSYKAANGVDAYTREGDVEIFYNQQFPLRKIVKVETDTIDLPALIKDAYYGMFVKAMRIPVLKQGVHSAGTPFKGYNYDEAPYSLSNRNAIINGKTEDGIVLTEHVEDRFIDLLSGTEYLQTWYEFLPQEVLDGTAPDGTVPLWLANHGGGDDPVQFVDEIGLLDLAGSERFAMVAPYYQSMYSGFGGGSDPVVLCKALCALVQYMLDTYPALDASRVYVTGYSLGGGASFHAIMEQPELFAAAIPMSAAGYGGTDEQKLNYEDVDLPILLTTSTYDLGGAFNTAANTIAGAYQNSINEFLGYNGMDKLTYDFETYPISGFKGDIYQVKTLNGEYTNHTWFCCREDGAPMVGVSYTQNLIHALYPEFGVLAWNYAKQFSRNQATLAIEYNPYA